MMGPAGRPPAGRGLPRWRSFGCPANPDAPPGAVTARPAPEDLRSAAVAARRQLILAMGAGREAWAGAWE